MNRSRLATAARRATPLIEPVERRVLMSVTPGSLDTTFGTGGLVVDVEAASTTGPQFASATAVLPLTNGQSLVGGVVNVGGQSGLYVRRYNADGSLDTTFAPGAGYGGSSGGYAYIVNDSYTNPFGEQVPDAVGHIAVDPAGHILVASFAGVTRLTAAGVPDTTFGTNGLAALSGVTNLAVTANNDVVAASTTFSATTDLPVSRLTRLTYAGQIDTTFGTGGSVTTAIDAGQHNSNVSLDIAAGNAITMPVAVLPNGQIVVGGQTGHADAARPGLTEEELAAERFNADGTVDATFGTNGVAAVGFDVLLGTGSYDSEDGPIDIFVDFDGMSVLPNGNVVVVGSERGNQGGDPSAISSSIGAEFLSTGQLNTSFGQNGLIDVLLTGRYTTQYSYEYTSGVSAQADGSLLLTGVLTEPGTTTNSTQTAFVVDRYTAAGQPDATFGTNGQVSTVVPVASNPAGYTPSEAIDAAAVTADGKLLVVGRAVPHFASPQAGFALARYVLAANTTPGAAVLSNGVLTVTGTAGADTIGIETYQGSDSAGTMTTVVVVNGVTQTFVDNSVAHVIVNAGDGNDTVSLANYYQDNQDVSVNGGAGDDSLSAGGEYAHATLDGGDGNDSFYAGGILPNYVTLLGGAGNDTFVADENAVADMVGGDGNDSFELLVPSCPVTVSGGAGTDTLKVDQGYGGTMSINLDGQADSTLYAPNFAPSTFDADIENVTFGSPQTQTGAKLTITGDALDNVITVYNQSYQNTTVHGGDGNDTITLNGAGGELDGDGGNDRLVANASGYVFALNGGDGNDTLVGSAVSQNLFSGGAGTDTVDYSARTDDLDVYLDGSKPSGDPTITVPSNAPGPDFVGNRDTFDGTVEIVLGGSGNDLLVANPAGGDQLDGNAGNDTLTAQGGADALFGGDGNDTLNAADGGATFVDGGTDTATVDATGDTTVNVETVIKAGGPAAVLTNGVLTVTGTAGADTISVYNTGGDGITPPALDVTVNGVSQSFDPSQAVALIINAGDGNDTVSVIPSVFLSSVTVNGGAGNDTITAPAVPENGTFTFNGGDGNDSLSVDNELAASATLNGGAGDDTIVVGDSTTANVDGGDGNDRIVLTYADRPATIVGGAGVDTLEVDPYYQTNLTLNLDGLPDSRLYGTTPATLGADIENLVVNAGGGNDVPGLSVTGDALDNVITATNIYNGATIHGGGGNDNITLVQGSLATNYLYGDGGNDTLNGGGASTYFSGGSGTDTVDYSAQTAGVTVYLDGSKPSGTAAAVAAGYGDTFDGTVEQVLGGSGNDLIVAAPGGGDTLYGNGGNDTLTAQGGADALFGGAGNDTFNARDGGPTTIDGGADTDTAYVDATGDTTVNVETVIPPTTTPTATRLTGTTGGTAGSYSGSGNTVAKATDGDLTTYFDGPTANGDVVTIDLGSAQAVSQIKFAPRVGWTSRMVGGVFQASNSASFSAGVVNVYTVTTAPAAGVLTTVATSLSTAYRYWRYVAPNGSYGNIAEFELFGTATSTPTPTPTQLTGTTTGTAGSYTNDGNTVAKATDGNVNTFFDGPTANGDTVVIDLGSAKAVAQIKYAPRAGWTSRMVGGIFQASNSADFSSGVVNVYTISATPTAGVLTAVATNTTTAYRYWRYLAPNGSYGNIAEFQLFGTGSTPTLTQRTGTTFGTAGSFQGKGYTIANATDGNVATYFDGPTASGDVVGLDLGSAQSVSTISYAPRVGWESRMVGGVFQASNTADFSSGVVNLYTVTTTPVAGKLTTVTVASPVTYRYYRYVAPANSYGDIAEFQLFG